MKLLERLGLRKFERRELHWLLVGLGACLFVLLFWMLASEVAEGDTKGFEIRIVQALRNPANPSLSVGPAWLQAAMVDVTALGGPTILGFTLAAGVGFLLPPCPSRD